MCQPKKRNKAEIIRLSIIRTVLLVFLFTVLTSNGIFASSIDSSSSISDPDISDDGSGDIPVGSDTDEGDAATAYRKGMVSAGLYHTVLLREDGTVYCWGDNSYGQLGTGTTENQEEPTQVPDLVNIVMVAAGSYHTVALSADGTVYAWGRNSFGQIGDGTSTASLKPVRIDSIPPAVSIAAGSYHTLALSIDGKIYAWGMNDDYQVGDVASENVVDDAGTILGKRVLTPQIVVESGVKAISAGGNHSLYLSLDGTVYAWGDNKYGQLGDGSQVSRGLPSLVYGLTNVISISAGYSHNMALTQTIATEKGTTQTYQSLYVWGSDSDGQLGLGEEFDETRYLDRPVRVDVTGDTNETNDRISLIQAGYVDSMVTVPVIKNEKRYDSVYVWGNNTYGQLGIGDLTSQNAPTLLIAKSNGWTGSIFLPFQSVAMGGYHTAFLSVKGFVGITGRANKGQLGNVSSIDTFIPIGVLVPDAIAPEWLEEAELQGVSTDRTLLLTWPEAIDNIKVTGYEITYLSDTGETKNIELGNVAKLTLFDVNQIYQQVISVRALDSSGNKSVIPLEFAYNTSGEQSRASSLAAESGAPESDGSQTSEAGEPEAPLSSEASESPDSFPEEIDSAGSEAVPSDEPETPAEKDPLIWDIVLYGAVTPLEVPWDVGYIYGEGVVLPPANYSWIIAICVALAVTLFFLFLGAVSFQKRHKGHHLFRGSSIPKDEKKMPKEESSLSEPEKAPVVVQIGDGIELVEEKNPPQEEAPKHAEQKKLRRKKKDVPPADSEAKQ